MYQMNEETLRQGLQQRKARRDNFAIELMASDNRTIRSFLEARGLKEILGEAVQDTVARLVNAAYPEIDLPGPVDELPIMPTPVSQEPSAEMYGGVDLTQHLDIDSASASEFRIFVGARMGGPRSMLTKLEVEEVKRVTGWDADETQERLVLVAAWPGMFLEQNYVHEFVIQAYGALSRGDHHRAHILLENVMHEQNWIEPIPASQSEPRMAVDTGADAYTVTASDAPTEVIEKQVPPGTNPTFQPWGQ